MRQESPKIETEKKTDIIYTEYTNINIAQSASQPRKKDKIYFCHIEKKFKEISVEDFENWKIAYPSVNLNQELTLQVEWLLSNPSKSNKKQWRKFITGWFQRTEEKNSNKAAYRSLNVSTDRRTKDMNGKPILSPADKRF